MAVRARISVAVQSTHMITWGLAGAHVNKCAISRGKAVSLWLKAGNLRDWLANRLGNRWPMNFIRNPRVQSFGRVASHRGN